MKSNSDAALPAVTESLSGVGFTKLRAAKILGFLSNPASYAVGTSILTLLSAGTAFVAPMVLAPDAFGAFALLTTFFQLAARSDLGLSQLADRELAFGGGDDARGMEILRARWLLGLAFAILFVPPAIIWLRSSSSIQPLDTAIALLGGILAMIAVGPVTLYRASSRIWEFTAAALILQAGMTLPRLIGILIGGTTGCYAVLLIWYGFFALLIARPHGNTAIRLKPMLALVRSALPLFVFSTGWMVYLFASRWISSAISDPWDFGLFAFGANLSYIVIGTIGAASQAFYPKVLAEIGRSPKGACSGLLLRQSVYLSFALSVPLALALPAAPYLIRTLFPLFSSATEATLLLAVAAVPLSIATWLLPIFIALSKKPGRDLIFLLTPAFATLYGGMFFDNLWFGLLGQAIGTIVSAIIVLVILSAFFFVQGVLTRRSAIALAVGLSALVALLSVEAVALLKHPMVAPAVPNNMLGETGVPSNPGIFSSERRLIFSETFDHLKLVGEAPDGVWEPAYPWGARSNPANGELEYYIDPRAGGERAPLEKLSPFQIKNGILSIIARPTPPELKSMAQGFSYLSGMLNTANTFSMTYGYVEVRARVPHGKGLWCAVWLLPISRGWPPEIDIMETLGDQTHTYFGSVHSNILGAGNPLVNPIATSDLSSGFGVYGMNWTPSVIEWFFNGKKVASEATPHDLHRPMYLLINLAVGGKWPGSPNASTAFPATFDIDYIKVYAPSESPSPRQPG